MKNSILITGITGQCASYLAELYLEKDFKVHGLIRRSSTNTCERIDHLFKNPNFELLEGNLCDGTGICKLIAEIQPTHCINTAAQSHVRTSFDEPIHTMQVNTIGVLNLLEAIKQNSPHTKFLQMSTSEMFGDSLDYPQNEKTVFEPKSAYGVSKLAAHHLVKIYREAYDLFACSAICFNMESSRRGENFVTRKITKYVSLLNNMSFDDKAVWADDLMHTVAKIGKLKLGNLESKRDWSHCRDTMEGLYLMLMQDDPDDFVFSSGVTHSIREFLDHAFGVINIEDWSDYVEIDPKFYRPIEVNVLCGDASKAKRVLGWEPKVKFEELVKIMMEADLNQKS